MAVTIIYLEDVTVDFNGFKALHDVNFFVDYGELRVLIGPNGAGKTTLLDVICGWVKPESGRVLYGEGKDIQRLTEHKIARLGISRKFQTHRSLSTSLYSRILSFPCGGAKDFGAPFLPH